MLFVSAEAEYVFKTMGCKQLLAGMVEVFLVVWPKLTLLWDFACMKTVEITRAKQAAVPGGPATNSFSSVQRTFTVKKLEELIRKVNAAWKSDA